MGALGAAIATVFSQAVSMITCIVVMIRNDFVFDFKPSSFIIKKEKAVKILKLGTPTAIQNGITSISFMIITTLVNMIGGVNASAAVGVVAKFSASGCGDGRFHFNHVCTKYWCRQMGQSG